MAEERPTPATLVELRVRDLGVVEDASLALRPGMTALTGETGAGKTLLVDALALLLGGRADPGLVRTGAAEATVEARFDLGPTAAEPEILLARSVPRRGRSRAWIDGRMASLAALAEAASGLFELHGQHQHRRLVEPAAQRDALDDFGAVDRGPMEAARRHLRQLERESEALGGDAHQRARESDLLRYQVAEIDDAAVADGAEDQRLEAEEERLAAAGELRSLAAAALVAVSGEGLRDVAPTLSGPTDRVGTGSDAESALDRLAGAARALSGRPPLAGLERRVRDAMAELADVGTELRSVVETWEDDPARLEEVRARRHLLHELRRKYGDTLEEVLAFAEDARDRLAAIAGDEQRAAALDADTAAAAAELEARRAEVGAARREAAPLLAATVEATLRTLAMPSARFTVSVEGSAAGDEVSFLLGANAGEVVQSLARTASGGELARAMLAIRLATSDAPGVLVFDEVDAGVGGTAATAVGAALSRLGGTAQVLVVTHLAQVAAQADHQVAVRKEESGGRTRSEVTPLTADERVVEVSRMLSGRPDSASARRHARELLDGRVEAGPARRPRSASRPTGVR